MYYEVIEISENVWGDDEITRGRFDSLLDAEQYIFDTYGENSDENVYIQNSWGEVVWG
jgi:hypothetical protein